MHLYTFLGFYALFFAAIYILYAILASYFISGFSAGKRMVYPYVNLEMSCK